MASPGPLQQSSSRPRSQPCPWQSIFHTVARESLLNRRQIMCLRLSEPPGVPNTLREQAKDPTMACMTCHLPSTPQYFSHLITSLMVLEHGRMPPPQDPCTCCSLCQEYSSPRQCCTGFPNSFKTLLKGHNSGKHSLPLSLNYTYPLLSFLISL